MKKFHFEYDWTDNCCWFLPDDEDMMQGQFHILDEQIDTVLEAISRTQHGNQRNAVQAGGCFGMYPIRLAYHFEHINTFEPFPKNMECLKFNVERHDKAIRNKIRAHEIALYDVTTMLHMEYPRPRDRAVSNGAQCVVHGKRGDIPATPLDLFNFEDLDLIWLDIEGAELRALMGAEATIEEHRPVVVIEERDFKRTANYSTTARKFLLSRGYKFIGKTHADAIFIP